MKTIGDVVKNIFVRINIELGEDTWKREKEVEVIKQELVAYRDSLLDEIEKKVSEYENEGNGRHSIMCIKEKIQRMREGK